MNVVREIRSVPGIDSNQCKKRSRSSDDAADHSAGETCVKSLAMNFALRCVSILWIRFGTSRRRSNGAPPPPVPRDMTWHADGTHGATHGAWCEAEKNQFECFSLAVVNHTGAGKHHYQENVYCSVMVIEKLQSCFSRLALGTFFFFMKQLRRQGNSKQAGWPQFVSAGWSEWTHSLSVSLLIMLLLHLAESKTFLCTSEDGACKPLR